MAAKILGVGKFLRLVLDEKWEFVERVNARGVVAIVAMTASRQIVLTEQFRPAVGRTVIDLPAGLVGDVQGQENEHFSTSALRELLEETGYSASALQHLADCPSSPGLTSEIISIFLSNEVVKIAKGGGVDGEVITVHSPSIRGIDRWLGNQLAAGKIIDTKVYAGLYFVKRRATAKNQ